MCGILGVISPDIQRPGEFYHFLDNLLAESNARGRDACGFAAVADGNFVTDKIDWNSEDFVKLNKEWRSLRKSRSLSLIGHTRAATNGSPTRNENNHPFHGPRYSMAHNGGIGAFRQIAKHNRFKLSTDCDSEIILHCLESKTHIRDGIVETFNQLDATGMMAVCTLDRETGSIHLFKCRTAPIVVMKFPRWNAIVFASTLSIIVSAATKVFGDWNKVRDHGELEFGKEAPTYSHIEITPSAKILCTDIYPQMKRTYKFAHRNMYYGSYFGYREEDYEVFAGGTSRFEKTSKKKKEKESKLENTAIMFKCIECGTPIEDDEHRGALHSVGANFMCNRCWKGTTDLNAIHGSSTKSSPIEESTRVTNKSAFLQSLIPCFPAELRSSVGETQFQDMAVALEDEREPVTDHEMDEIEVGAYLRFSDFSIGEKIDCWSNMTLKRAFEMGDGEYLAYADLITDAAETYYR